LDHISHGRAGWLLQAETDPAVAAAVGRTVLGLEATAREAADVLVAARRVWDSWAPDAVVRDTERGVYVDAARLQYTDIETETFSVRGPAITPRSPQGLLPALVADTDRAAVGERVRGELADGRVLDLDVSGGARAKQLAARIEAARADGVGRAAADGATTDAADGADGADRADGAAAVGADGAATGTAGTVRLVRLVGLDLEADPLGTVAQLAADLRARGLIAPLPRQHAAPRRSRPRPRRSPPARPSIRSIPRTPPPGSSPSACSSRV